MAHNNIFLKNDETILHSQEFKLKFSNSVGVDWKTLGRKLNIKDNYLDMIDQDNVKTCVKAYEMLTKWIQMNAAPSLDKLKTALRNMERKDLIIKLDEFANISIPESISTIENRIKQGCVFKFVLPKDEICRGVEFQLYNDAKNWATIINKKHSFEYYLTKKKNDTLFVKVENLMFENEKINFKFSFQDSKNKTFQHYCSAIITGNCNYELIYNGLFIATPEPIFNNKFRKRIRKINSLDWRETNNIHLAKAPHESIELFALDYFDRNFYDYNEVIYVSPLIADNENLFFVVSKFNDLLTVNKTGIRAVLPGYRLRYHATLLKFDVKKFTNYKDENRIIIFCSKLNLVIIARVATSMDCIKLESECCLNDVILFVNINNPLIDTNKLVILGIVILPFHDRKYLKEELFFHFSENFDLDQILFLCKDEIADDSFESWWRSVVSYCIKKVNSKKNSNEILFKKLISLTMMSMAKVDHCFPTLESDPQKQIQSLILNVEQRNAINDKALKKIITGGYGSGKSIVGREIVKNYVKHKSEKPLTLYYICCNHFSLYECHMKKFVDNIEKASNVTVICDNLYELWKSMCRDNNMLKKDISLPILLEYLANTNSNKVCFVLEELSEEFVREDDAIQIKHLFTSVLKESLVVFIPESITKNRKLVTSKQKRTLQRNFFQEDIIGMKVISLNKSMRVTRCNKLLIDVAQKAISETKSVLDIQNTNFRFLQKIEKNKLFGNEDLQIEKVEDFQSLSLTLNSNIDSKNETKNKTSRSMENNEKDSKKTNDTLPYNLNYVDTVKTTCLSIVNLEKDTKNETKYDTSKSTLKTSDMVLKKVLKNQTNYTLDNNLNGTIKVKDNYNASLDIKKDDNYASNIAYDKNIDKLTDSDLYQRIENKFTIVNDFHDNDLDYMAKLIAKNTNNVDQNSYMETEYVFRSGFIGHSVEGEKPKVVYLPFHDIANKQSVKLLSIVLENLCFDVLRKTVVICSNMEEVQSVAYAIDIIGNFKAITYSPHLQKYSPTLETKIEINKKLRSDMDILITDSKGFSGAESEFVIVFVSPEEIYYRHVLVDAISRSNSHLMVFVKSYSEDKEPLNIDKTIGNVLNNLSEDVVEKIKVVTSNNKNQKSLDGFFIIDEDCKEFIDRGVDNDFDKYKENLQFKIFHENNIIYETMAYDLSKQTRKEFINNASVLLKEFYIQTYNEINEFQPPLYTTENVDSTNKFIDLSIAEGIIFEKRMNYKQVSHNEVFMKEKSLLLVSGIAGIGKSWLLKKCLIDWSTNLIWKKVDFVFYFEYRLLNKYQCISNINELLVVFYKDFVKFVDINIHSIIFVIDGLDEFKYFDDLINYSSFSQYPIVNALSEIHNYKCVIAGRVYAVDQYRNVCQMSKMQNNKLTIQIMGFNQNSIYNYIEKNIVVKNKIVKTFFKNFSPVANAMTSIPFFLSSMCKIVESKQCNLSLLTITYLCTGIFFYFYQKHIMKTEIPVDEIMENDEHKKYILNICKIAYESFVRSKVVFSRKEIQTFISDFDKVEHKLFGFIERIETDLGFHYQFVHSAIMEFCASVYAYNCLSSEEIMATEKLESCLSMICGLTNKSQNSLIKFLVNLNPSKKPYDDFLLPVLVNHHLLMKSNQLSIVDSGRFGLTVGEHSTRLLAIVIL
ncbi:uncharacterized protein LOC105848542 isoform X2 [Hydra vulgaris]|uniref:uncharacterized protein LOC105848542 isoform X2 n=1 Tax=Hydra vulgaris TaxID=6087 RepID=UPI001F5FF4DB|nr:uncharacterized protein LOC105848542 isoform X2 [Hydra vulgaris]